MPVPIKSLQSVLLAASYIFGELKISKPGMKLGEKKENDKYNKKIAKIIAKDVPDSSGKFTINDADAADETRIIQQDMNGQVIEIKTVDLCKRVEDKVIKEADNYMGRGGQAERVSKVTLDSITSYNQKLVNHQEIKKSELRKLLHHERLYKMMKVGAARYRVGSTTP